MVEPSLEQQRTIVRVRRGSEPATSESAAPWARRFEGYAALCAIVYRDQKDNLPTPPGWTESPDPSDRVDDSKTSLYLEVWEKTSQTPVEVAIVFRGTHEFKDWWSNLRWITRFIPTGCDQYTLVRQIIASLVDRARERHPGAFLVTSGHSLGGGLAQQAAYAHDSIKKVVAFDPSPVTGYKSVQKRIRLRDEKCILIERVFEHGEILAYIRQFLRRFLPVSSRDPEIVEVRFNLSKGDPITQHSMVDLAKRMARAARKLA